MRALRAWLVRLGETFDRRRTEQDIAEEIESSLRLDIEDGMRQGLSPEDARRRALVRFGGVESAKESWRDRRGIPLLDALGKDIAYAFRLMGRSKGWTSVAILSLALGIGANTALFSVVYDAVLARLPVDEPERLVAFRWTGDDDPGGVATYTHGYVTAGEGPLTGATFPRSSLEALQTAGANLESVFGFAPASVRIDLPAAEGVSVQYVSGEYYRGLGISPLLGRVLTPDDDQPAAPPVAVIASSFWQSAFGADPAVLGTAIPINDTVFTIVGVVRNGVSNAQRVNERDYDVSIPLAMEPLLTPPGFTTSLDASMLMLMGRLSDGADREQVERDLQEPFRRGVLEHRQNRPGDATARPPRLIVVAGGRGVYDIEPNDIRVIFLFGGVFGLVLAIVCINLATLTLSRSETRLRELATRLALGASRGRLVRQFLTESLVLAFSGAAVGLFAAWFVMPFLEARSMTWEPTVLVFAATLTLLSGLVCGSAPALGSRRFTALGGIKEAANTVAGSRSRLGKSLLVGQVALTLALVVAAGLFLRTIDNLRRVPVGFNPNDVWVFQVDLGYDMFDTRGNPELRERSIQIYDGILERLAAAPGVRAATRSNQAFLSGQWGVSDLHIEGQDAGAPEAVPQLTVHYNFFDAMQIPLLLGRRPDRQDYQSATDVALVNEAFARAFFADGTVVGRRFGADAEGNNATEIVGVVGDVKYSSLRDPEPPMLFRVHRRSRRGLLPGTFHVALPGSGETVVPTLRSVVRSVDPTTRVINPRSHAAMIQDRYAQERAFALVSSLFGTLALGVSMIGLYGLMSYAVVRRTREIGIRMALGAGRTQVLRATLGESLALVAVGIVIGLAGALAATRSIESLLFGLRPNDPATIAGAVVVMLAVSTAAAYLPARRASSVNPIVALREE